MANLNSEIGVTLHNENWLKSTVQCDYLSTSLWFTISYYCEGDFAPEVDRSI